MAIRICKVTAVDCFKIVSNDLHGGGRGRCWQWARRPLKVTQCLRRTYIFWNGCNTKQYNKYLQACISATYKMRTVTLSRWNPVIIPQGKYNIDWPAFWPSSFASLSLCFFFCWKIYCKESMHYCILLCRATSALHIIHAYRKHPHRALVTVHREPTVKGEKTNKMQQSDVYYQLLSQHVSSTIMPIFRRSKTVLLHMAYCSGSAGCGW